MKRSYTGMLFAAFVGFMIVSAAGCSNVQPGGSIEDNLPTITVSGTGKVTASPDQAIATFGVSSQNRRLEKAYSSNTASMNAVIKSVKGLGVDKADITTSSYRVTPVYPRDENGRRLPGKPESFRVDQQISVRIRELSRSGAIIDSAISSGTNTFNGISFISSNAEQLQKKAKARAARDAAERAALLAGSLGVKLGRVLKVGTGSVAPYPARNVMAFKDAAMESAPQIEPGTMEVRATCTVIYEIVQ